MNASFTNVIGLRNVLARIKDCWASLYGERVLAYRAEQHLGEEPAIAVIIQKMIFSEVSGVMFTADPTTGARDRMIIGVRSRRGRRQRPSGTGYLHP